jgi:endonuclease G, mitochondrial
LLRTEPEEPDVLAAPLLAATEQRYQARTPARAASQAALSQGRTLHADTPERVRRRLARLTTPAAATMATVDAGPPAPDLVGLQPLIGVNNLIDARFLALGAQVARTVARIAVKEPSGLIAEFGTGFLVGPGLLLTNHHVLQSSAQAAVSEAEFGYEQDLAGQLTQPTTFRLDPAALFVTDPALDYTLIGVHPTANDGASLTGFGWSRLIAQEGKAILGEALNVIQHPGGQPKTIALRDNHLVTCWNSSCTTRPIPPPAPLAPRSTTTSGKSWPCTTPGCPAGTRPAGY